MSNINFNNILGQINVAKATTTTPTSTNNSSSIWESPVPTPSTQNVALGYYDFNQLVNIADSNQDGSISTQEFDFAEYYLDLNGDNKADAKELEFVETIAMLDGKSGLSADEVKIAEKAEDILADYKSKTRKFYNFTDNDLKTAQDWAEAQYDTDTNPFANTKAIDLNKNGIFDTFEKQALDLGVNTDTTTHAKMLKIADKNNDGFISDVEFNNVKMSLDLNGNEKVTKNELDLVNFIAQLDAENGINSLEADIIALIQESLDDKTEITDAMLNDAKTSIQEYYDTAQMSKIIDLNQNGKIDDFEQQAFDAGLNTDTDTVTPEEMVTIFDLNQDGVVSEDEFLDSADLMDINDDGKIERKEIDFLQEIAELDGKSGLDDDSHIFLTQEKQLMNLSNIFTKNSNNLSDTYLSDLKAKIQSSINKQVN